LIEQSAGQFCSQSLLSRDSFFLFPITQSAVYCQHDFLACRIGRTRLTAFLTRNGRRLLNRRRESRIRPWQLFGVYEDTFHETHPAQAYP
jgi:hypothetical protein